MNSFYLSRPRVKNGNIEEPLFKLTERGRKKS
jgi:hypothetical protein